MAYETGDWIGDYQVVGRLGAGGMGAVYKVRNAITDRVEAMKVLLPDLRDTPGLVERFGREIKLHANLVHPNIAAIHTAVRVGYQLLMIMELLEGYTLRERLLAGPVGAVESIGYACQILSALGYAHQHGVVHRDIKPANIMISPEGIVKLMDFGIAADTSGAHQRLTVSGVALGSVHYMSPEQVRAQPLDARSDLYSLGVTLFETVTGRCPMQGDSEYAIMNAHLTEMPVSPHSINPHLPPALSPVILKALEKRPEDRFPTAAAFRAALELLSCGHTPSRRAGASQESTAASSRPVVPPAPAAGQWESGMLENLTRELAVYIGPMARILVQRASRRAQNAQQLYAALAAEIPSPEDRARFLSRQC